MYTSFIQYEKSQKQETQQKEYCHTHSVFPILITYKF